LDNPFKQTSKNHQLFEMLANADRPLRPDEIAASVDDSSSTVVHSMLKDLRARGFTVYRYRDPQAHSPTASVYGLRPVEGLTELVAAARPRRPRSGPPAPVRPAVRQPLVGSVARIVGVTLDGDAVQASFECEGVAYRGTMTGAQPTVGEWMTLVTVGLHGQGLSVDLAGARILTLEDITEVHDGAR
jgi:hypothetical protein